MQTVETRTKTGTGNEKKKKTIDLQHVIWQNVVFYRTRSREMIREGVGSLGRMSVRGFSEKFERRGTGCQNQWT